MELFSVIMGKITLILLKYKYIDVDKIGHAIYKDKTLLNKVTDLFGNKPAAATDWNVQVGKGTQYYGIVNTADKYFNKLENLNTSNLKNPYGSANINNNLLMLYNESEDTLSYTSSTRSLEANSYHKFDISLLTQLPNPNKDTVSACVPDINCVLTSASSLLKISSILFSFRFSYRFFTLHDLLCQTFICFGCSPFWLISENTFSCHCHLC